MENLTNYNPKPNSNKFKEQQRVAAEEEKKPIQKVVKGPVKRKPKSGFQKFVGSFIAEDLPKVREYIFNDIIIPTAKQTFVNMVNAFIFGEGSKVNSNLPASKVSYNEYYNRTSNATSRRPAVRSTYSYDDIILATKGEAEMVLRSLDDIISQYGLVRVADLYELVGWPSNYTDNNYGWMDLRSAQAIRVQGGYLLKLPRAVPLD